MKGHVGPSVSLAATIVRACDECGYRREVGKPCAGCGNKRPARVSDLGVIASNQRSRWEQFKWNCWGRIKANKRIRKTNKEMLEKWQ